MSSSWPAACGRQRHTGLSFRSERFPSKSVRRFQPSNTLRVNNDDDISNEQSMGYKAEELLRAALKLTDPGTVKRYIFFDPELYEILAVGIDACIGRGWGDVERWRGRCMMHRQDMCVND